MDNDIYLKLGAKVVVLLEDIVKSTNNIKIKVLGIVNPKTLVKTKQTEETWFYRLDMPEGYKNFSKTKPMQIEHFNPVFEWWNDRKEITVDDFDKSKKYSLQEIIDRNYNIDLCGFPHEEEEILAPKELIQQYQEKRSSLNADIDRVLDKITNILGIDINEDQK